MLLVKRPRNSSRTVEVAKIVSGERPSRTPAQPVRIEADPGQEAPRMTFRATLKDVLKVQ